MAAFEDFGFDDESVGGGRPDRRPKLKFKDKEKVRVSLAWWPGAAEGDPNFGASSPVFRKVWRHYVENVGYFVSNGPEFVKLAGGNAPKLCIATVVVRWPLLRDGVSVDKDNVLKNYSIHPWLLSQDKFTNLKSIHGNYSLGENDLSLECTGAEFQKLLIVPAKGNLLATLVANRAKYGSAIDQILEEVKDTIAGIDREIARDYTLDELRQKLGLSVAGPSPVSSDANIDEMLGNVLDL